MNSKWFHVAVGDFIVCPILQSFFLAIIFYPLSESIITQIPRLAHSVVRWALLCIDTLYVPIKNTREYPALLNHGHGRVLAVCWTFSDVPIMPNTTLSSLDYLLYVRLVIWTGVDVNFAFRCNGMYKLPFQPAECWIPIQLEGVRHFTQRY